jgi:DNA-binding protein HU-beta
LLVVKWGKRVDGSLMTWPMRRAVDSAGASGTFSPSLCACERAAAPPREELDEPERQEVTRMNKGELIEAVAAELGDSKAGATRAVEALIKCITNGVKEDDNVTIVGFGTFKKKNRAARTGRNPMTGEPISIKAATTIGFTASQNLKQEMAH